MHEVQCIQFFFYWNSHSARPTNKFNLGPGNCMAVLGWGLLSQFSPFRYFPNFWAMLRQTLAIEYHVFIWKVSPQLSCGDTCQIWMWFEESNMYFCHIENFAYGEINERSFSNPHPWWNDMSIMQNIWIYYDHQIFILQTQNISVCHSLMRGSLLKPVLKCLNLVLIGDFAGTRPGKRLAPIHFISGFFL